MGHLAARSVAAFALDLADPANVWGVALGLFFAVVFTVVLGAKRREVEKHNM